VRYRVATGGDDGKVKVWSTYTGFCFITFTEHTAPILCVAFAKSANILFSNSLDGTVRAYDLIRYRNFRTFISPSLVHFSSLAVDPSSEVVAAGSTDSFEVFLWSLHTGRLLDVTFFNIQEDSKQTNIIEGRKNISGGRKLDDQVSPGNSTSTKT
jgi:periodic tryptophan protein 2